MKVLLLLAAAAAPAAAFTTGFAPSRTAAPLRDVSLNAEAAADGVANGTDKKKVIILGGDGFCGWPTSLYLSDQGHDVVVVDNLSRRNIDTELGCDSLTPIQPPEVSIYCSARASLCMRGREQCACFLQFMDRMRRADCLSFVRDASSLH